MKSAQNTPSRQPMVPPHNMAPPTLQENRQAVLGGGDFKKVKIIGIIIVGDLNGLSL